MQTYSGHVLQIYMSKPGSRSVTSLMTDLTCLEYILDHFQYLVLIFVIYFSLSKIY